MFKNWYIKISQNVRIWLDDERDPKNPFIQKEFGAMGNEIWVKTPEEAIRLLEQGNVESISLDHDLGENIGSGEQVAKWIEEKAYFGKISPLIWRVHSQNPVGAKNIFVALSNADRFWQKK